MKNFFPSLNTDANKIILSSALSYSLFWTPVVVTYYLFRGIDVGDVFVLVSFCFILVMLFEYPSGVIGDYFSHRNTVIAGYIVIGFTSLAMCFPGTFWYYLVLQVFYAIGLSLYSGSDTALLHNHSKNFKKDLSNVGFVRLIFLTGALVIGGLTATIHLALPTFLHAIFLFVAAGLLFTIPQTKTKSHDHEGNIFHSAKKGLQYAVSQTTLRWTLLFAAIFAAFTTGQKWLFNPLFESVHIDIVFWGALAAIFTLLRAFGSKLYGQYSKISIALVIVVFAIGLALSGWTDLTAFSILGFSVFSFALGYIETKSTYQVNHLSTDGHRASILSLKSLLGRLIGSGMLLATGYVLELYSFTVLVLLIAATAFVSSFFFIWLISKSKRHSTLEIAPVQS